MAAVAPAAAAPSSSHCPTTPSGPLAAIARALPTLAPTALRQLQQQRCRALPLDTDGLLLLGGGGDDLLPLRAALYAALAGAAYASAAWPDRPRGWSRRDLLEVGWELGNSGRQSRS